MKKGFVLFCFAVLTVNTFAQDTKSVSTEKNVLKVNTLAAIVGTGSIFYERQLSDLTSAQLGFGYLSYKIGDTRFGGLILTPEFRVYPKKDAIDGFYLAPYLRYQNFSVENKVESSKGTLTAMGGGVAIGRQWISNSGFTMDLFFGGHYSSSEIKVESGTNSFDSDNFEGFRMRIGFDLGFAF